MAFPKAAKKTKSGQRSEKVKIIQRLDTTKWKTTS